MFDLSTEFLIHFLNACMFLMQNIRLEVEGVSDSFVHLCKLRYSCSTARNLMSINLYAFSFLVLQGYQYLLCFEKMNFIG